MTPRALAVLLTVAVLAAAAWFLLSPGEPPARAGDPREVAAEDGSPEAAGALKDREGAGAALERDETGDPGTVRRDAASRVEGGQAGSTMDEDRARIRLRLLDGAGDAATEAWARVVPRVEGMPWNVEEASLVRTGGARHRPDAEGWVEIPVAPGGALDVIAEGDRWRPVTRRVRAPRAGELVTLPAVRLLAADLITGTVTDPDDDPVAGARVRLAPSGATLFDGGDGVRVARTDAEGRFRLPGVPRGRYTLRAEDARFAPAVRETVEIPGQGDAHELSLQLERGGEVRGRIVDEDGRPVAGARAWLRVARSLPGGFGPPREDPATVTADAQGRFVLGGVPQDEASRVVADAPGHGRATAAVPTDGSEVLLTLPRAVRFAGVLLDPDGMPVPEVVIALEPADAAAQSDGAASWLLDRVEARTDASGRFAFERVDPGVYAIHAHTAEATTAGRAVDLLRDRTGAEVRMEPAAFLSVRVEDATGDPVAGARLSLQRSDAPLLGGERLVRRRTEDGDGSPREEILVPGGAERATTDARGIAAFPDAVPGPYRLQVEAEGMAAAEHVFTRGVGAQQERVRLLPGTGLRVRAVNAAGQPVPQVEIAVVPLDGLAAPVEPSVTDDAGRAVWTHLAPGPHRIGYRAGAARQRGLVFTSDELADEGGDDGEALHGAREIVLAAGPPQEVTLTIADLALPVALITRGDAPAAGVEVWLEAPAAENAGPRLGRPAGTLSDGAGRAELRAVEPGEWVLVARAASHSPEHRRTITLHPGENLVEMDVAGRTVTGTLLGEDGPLAGARVRLERGGGDDEAPRRAVAIVSISDDGSGPEFHSEIGAPGTPRATTDADGVFVFADVPPGPWEARAQARGHAGWESGPFTVGPAQDVDLGAHHLVAGGTLRGRVADFEAPTGGRIGPQHLLRLEDADGRVLEMAPIGADGRYAFRDLAPGEYFVVRGEDRAGPVEVVAGGTATLDL